MPPLLIAATAASSVENTRAGPVIRYTPSSPTTLGSIDVLLITDPPGARLPLGNVTVDVNPRRRGPWSHRPDGCRRAPPTPAATPPAAPIAPTIPASRPAWNPRP